MALPRLGYWSKTSPRVLSPLKRFMSAFPALPWSDRRQSGSHRRARQRAIVAVSCAVPEHYIRTVHVLIVLVIVHVRGVAYRSACCAAVVNLIAVIGQIPYVGNAKRISDSVFEPWSDDVASARDLVSHAPHVTHERISWLAELGANRVPARPENEKQKAVKHVLGKAVNVEVKSPVRVVIVRFAHASVLHCGKGKCRLDRPVQIKSPLLDIAIPSRSHLRRENQPVRPFFGGHAIECARLRSGMGAA